MIREQRHLRIVQKRQQTALLQGGDRIVVFSVVKTRVAFHCGWEMTSAPEDRVQIRTEYLQIRTFINEMVLIYNKM
jgi:hypothetical protein